MAGPWGVGRTGWDSASNSPNQEAAAPAVRGRVAGRRWCAWARGIPDSSPCASSTSRASLASVCAARQHTHHAPGGIDLVSGSGRQGAPDVTPAPVLPPHCCPCRPPGCTPLSSAACRRDCSPARPGRPPCSPPCHSGDSWPVRSYRELGCRRRVLSCWARIDSSRRGCRCTCFQPAGAGAVFARGVRTISPAPNIVRSLASRYQSVPLFVRLNSAAVIHCTTSSGSDAARHFLAVSAWLPASSPPSPLVPSRAQLPPWQLAAHLSARRLRGVPRAAPRSAHPAARHSQCPLPGAPASWSQPEFESRPYMVGLELGLYRHLRSLISWILTFDNSIIHLFGASGFENGGLNQQSYSMNSIIRPVNVINKSNSHRPRATQLPSDSHLAQHFKLSGRKTPPSIPCISIPPWAGAVLRGQRLVASRVSGECFIRSVLA